MALDGLGLEAEVVEAVAMDAVLVPGVGRQPSAGARLVFGAEVIAEVPAGVAHDLDRLGDEPVVGDVEEPRRVGPGAAGDRPFGADAQRLDDLGPEPPQVEAVGEDAPEPRREAAERGEHPERVRCVNTTQASGKAARSASRANWWPGDFSIQ